MPLFSLPTACAREGILSVISFFISLLGELGPTWAIWSFSFFSSSSSATISSSVLGIFSWIFVCSTAFIFKVLKKHRIVSTDLKPTHVKKSWALWFQLFHCVFLEVLSQVSQSFLPEDKFQGVVFAGERNIQVFFFRLCVLDLLLRESCDKDVVQGGLLPDGHI